MNPISFQFPYKLWQLHPHDSLPLLFVETTNLKQKCFEIFAIDLNPPYKCEIIFSYHFEEHKVIIGAVDNFLIAKGFPSINFPISKGVFAWNFVKKTYELHEPNATWIALERDKLTYKLENEIKQLVFNLEAKPHKWGHEEILDDGKLQIHQIRMGKWVFETKQEIAPPYKKYLEIRGEEGKAAFYHELDFAGTPPLASCMISIDEQWIIVQSSRSSLLLFDLSLQRER